jgi:hypothetical protein
MSSRELSRLASFLVIACVLSSNQNLEKAKRETNSITPPELAGRHGC